MLTRNQKNNPPAPLGSQQSAKANTLTVASLAPHAPKQSNTSSGRDCKPPRKIPLTLRSLTEAVYNHALSQLQYLNFIKTTHREAPQSTIS